MKLRYIMTVGDIIYHVRNGHIIVGSKKHNRDEDRIYIGRKEDQIFVGTDNLKYKFEVKDISVSTAFIGDTIIGILVYDSEDIHSIKVGDKVYAIVGKQHSQ